MDNYDEFKDKLDKEHQWPTVYMFKFVVPKNKIEDFNLVFEHESVKSKESKAGNYMSFTINKMINSSQEVVDIYLKAKSIEGLIAL